MRKLLYVPIIHGEADLGSLGPEVERRSASLSGKKRWAQHKAAVAEFWHRVSEYLRHQEAAHLKIYQDGLSVGGELGGRVVEEVARRGSQNYEVILHLIESGAEIRATEDASLLRQEYQYMDQLTRAGAPSHPSAEMEYETHKARLTAERDQFIAKTINKTLREGEVGILFLGAYHDALPHLARDIVVEKLKEPEMVRAYFRSLTQGKDDETFEQLARYIASPVAGRL